MGIRAPPLHARCTEGNQLPNPVFGTRSLYMCPYLPSTRLLASPGFMRLAVKSNPNPNTNNNPNTNPDPNPNPDPDPKPDPQASCGSL